MSTPIATYTPYERGAQAARRGSSANACPYPHNPALRDQWISGYRDREREIVEAERRRRRATALHARSAWFRQQRDRLLVHA